MMGLSSRQGHSACHVSLKDHLSQCGFNECMLIDLPSFDVVEEGDFNVHQEWQQGYLWVTRPQSASCHWYWLFHLASDWTNVMCNCDMYSISTELMRLCSVRKQKKCIRSDALPFQSWGIFSSFLSSLGLPPIKGKIHCCQVTQTTIKSFIHPSIQSFICVICLL